MCSISRLGYVSGTVGIDENGGIFLVWYTHNNQPYCNEDGGSHGFNNILFIEIRTVYARHIYLLQDRVSISLEKARERACSVQYIPSFGLCVYCYVSRTQ